MTAGHFGFAVGVKKWAPRLPLWALLLSTYWLDVIFIILFALGIEGFAPVNPAGGNSYGGMIIHAYYTHSLVGALLLSGAAGWLASRFWGKRSGWVITAVAFSHWLLDLLVHRPDLPVLPGNLGNLPLLGFGLWRFSVVSAVLELALILGGSYLYFRSAMRLPTPSDGNRSQQRRRVVEASGVTAVLLILLLTTDLLGL
jgi:hypothetical protein